MFFSREVKIRPSKVFSSQRSKKQQQIRANARPLLQQKGEYIENLIKDLESRAFSVFFKLNDQQTR